MKDQGLFVLECLSPIHVGSGDELAQGLDYYADGGRTKIMDWEKMVSHPAAQGLADWIAANFIRGRGRPQRVSILGFLEERRIDPAAVRVRAIAGAVEASRIRLAIRAADGRPIIPGTSLKGAIRAQPLEQALFRQALRPDVVPGRSKLHRDAKGDLLRMLKISDAFFPSETLDVLSTKALGTARNTLTAVEALRAGAGALVMLQLGDALLEQRMFSRSLPDLKTLAQWLRQHATYLLEGDKRFFKNFAQSGNRAAGALIGRCDELLGKIEALSNQQAIVIRLGWGTGWRTMTGDLLSDAERPRLSGADTQTARYVGQDKTRKAVTGGHRAAGAPADLLGWVCLRRATDKNEVCTLASEARPPKLAPPPREPLPERAPEPQFAPIPVAVDSLLQRIESLKPKDWGLVRQLAQDIRSAEPAARRQTLIEQFETRLKQAFRKRPKKGIEQIMAELRASPR
jgi:CRISPR-associated protein Csm5